MIELSRERRAAKNLEPRKLLIFGMPKVGKTELCMQLPNSLLIDLEGGSDFYEGTAIDVKAAARKLGLDMLGALKEVTISLEKQFKDNNNTPVYDYIILDNTTELEDIANALACINYKNTLIGKNWQGNNITLLPNGAGEGFLRDAFETIYKRFEGYFNKSLIIIAHVKNASITKNGVDLQAKDLNLRGKLKLIVSSDMDAIGYLYRSKSSNINMLSFITNEQDLATGSRCQYLAGKEFKISEKNENGTVTTHWDDIYPSLKEKVVTTK